MFHYLFIGGRGLGRVGGEGMGGGGGGKVTKSVSINHREKRERRVETGQNRGPSAYLPNALPQSQTGSWTFTGLVFNEVLNFTVRPVNCTGSRQDDTHIRIYDTTSKHVTKSQVCTIHRYNVEKQTIGLSVNHCRVTHV